MVVVPYMVVLIMNEEHPQKNQTSLSSKHFFQHICFVKEIKFMKTLEMTLTEYLFYCKFQKRLDPKTIKSYQSDLTQFLYQVNTSVPQDVTPSILELYLSTLHQKYKPKTAKRKIASVKAFFNYLVYKEYISNSPFRHTITKFREPITLPKTIPLNTIEQLLTTMYNQKKAPLTPHKNHLLYRDIAIIELLFSTGIRIAELCSLKKSNVDLSERTIIIYGKGAKERLIQIPNESVYSALTKYVDEYSDELVNSDFFFLGCNHAPISDQIVRRMIRKYCDLASIQQHITPHMFRHTFATSLLEADVDIRYIQKMLGHSSIHITEIYTHVSNTKQREILEMKHPRKFMKI